MNQLNKILLSLSSLSISVVDESINHFIYVLDICKKEPFN